MAHKHDDEGGPSELSFLKKVNPDGDNVLHKVLKATYIVGNNKF